jgi:hypothetical protein
MDWSLRCKKSSHFVNSKIPKTHRDRDREREREREQRVSELGATTDEHDPHELLTYNWN